VDATIDHRNFDWTCHVCLTKRPNDRIGVAKHIHIYPSGVEMSEHVHYCNDNPRCAEIAMRHDFSGIALMWARGELEDQPGLAALIGGVIFGLALGVLWTLLVVNGFGWAF
jgi:uncharacterized membrane-anchored protein YitT (DUF2179 family)